MHPFNAQAEIEKVRAWKTLGKRNRYHSSKLNAYRAELVQLRKRGLSFPELALWLRREKSKTVSHTAILRYLKKLPEMQELSQEG